MIRLDMVHELQSEAVEYVLNPLCNLLHYIVVLQNSHLIIPIYSSQCQPSAYKGYIYRTLKQGWACWADEDYVGRCSRISRRCHSFTTASRTISRALMQYKRVFREIMDDV